MPSVKSGQRLRDLPGARRGATAVEFAIVAVPFFALLFTILELGMMFMTSTALEAATLEAAREIRTGQLQSGANNTAAGFKTLVCNNMSWISSADCQANLSLDVRTFASFADVSITDPPEKNGAIDTSQLGFDSGAACNIVLVRVFYPYALITPLLEPGLPDLGSDKRLLSATSAFRNENWQAEGPPCG